MDIVELPEEGVLLRIFIGESDKYEGRPLYEWLTRKAREDGLAGATVIRGLMGYGANSRIRETKILRLSLDQPVIIELVDKPDRIEKFLSSISGVVREGLITMEKATIRFYKPGKPGG
ncbi:MAG: DUF190 domain-containing protein [Dehalococcoidales bacterium]|nr:DUF190 domain-containing protein [Dehalococcoidales bacterium]MDD4465185.1 DUF190 domain-containing protein [Dehalococcoidales bacterium]MDD5402427.1 DUF190 domain-containing protein [Dehalococcoidales bacterium]